MNKFETNLVDSLNIRGNMKYGLVVGYPVS